MNTKEILRKLDIALNMLFSNDIDLLKRELNERCISHKLAEYLQPLFNGYNVDCEYNGDKNKMNDIKALSIADSEINKIGLESNEKGLYRISPDIIIHERGSNDKNLLVIEVKKDISIEKYKLFDIIKLKKLTTDYSGNHYDYKIGIAIEFATGRNAGKMKETFFQNGTLITERKKLN